MKKIISILMLGFFLLSFTGADTDVYICKGPQSKKYHYTKFCQGLRNCSTDIYKVTLTEAKEMGRTLCGYED